MQDLDALSVKQQNTTLEAFAAEMDFRWLSIDPGIKRDETGMVLFGTKGNTVWVLGDFSGRMTKQQYEAKAVEIADTYMQDGDRILVETNAHGGADEDLRVKCPKQYVEGIFQQAGQGKIARAEKAYQLYEQGLVKHFRIFPTLHQQMAEFYAVVEDRNRSPDRVDALATGIKWHMERGKAGFAVMRVPLNVRFGY